MAERTLGVIGGGVIGLACALRAMRDGWCTTVYDAGVVGRASWVAAAMLGTLGEGRPGEEPRVALVRRSVGLWPKMIADLDDSRLWAARRTVFVGADAADVAEFRRLSETIWAGENVVPMPSRDIREIEPALGPRVRSGFLAGDEGALDNRRLIAAMRSTVIRRGGSIVDDGVDRVDDVPGDQILVSAGIASRRLVPDVPLIAVKGEAVRLSYASDAMPPPTATVRAKVYGRDVYVVPRPDGVVVGATQYESADEGDLAPCVGGVTDLLNDAFTVMPGIRHYRISDIASAMRPVAPDGLPIIGRVDARTVVATGHGREGVALAPLTAERVVKIIDG